MKYPDNFLHDIEKMSQKERQKHGEFLISWVERYWRGDANPKWVVKHMSELAQLLKWNNYADAIRKGTDT